MTSDESDLGRCKTILAARADSDIFFFEVEPSAHALQVELTPLRLALFAPAENARLHLLGYPGDKWRQQEATVTRNCWVLQSKSPSRRELALEEARVAGVDPKNPPSDEWKKALASELQDADPRFKHNCSVYGGNSGGPMILEGSDIVVGIPNTYIETKEQKKGLLSATDLKDAAESSRIEPFAKAFKASLSQAGVIFAESPTAAP